MSKFFARLSDSDTDSSSDNESIAPVERKKTTFPNYVNEDSEAKRVVRSAADKQKKELGHIIGQIKNLKKIRDFCSLLNAFGELVHVFEKYGNSDESSAFFRCLAEVDDYVSEAWEDRISRQNMTKLAAKSLVALRQNVKRYVKTYVDQLVDYRLISAVDDAEDDKAAEREIAETDPVESKGSSDWGDTEDSDSSGEESRSRVGARAYFKKNVELPTVKRSDLKALAVKRPKKVESQKESEEKGWQTISGLGFSSEYQSFLKEEVSVSSVVKILSVLTGAKNRKQSGNRQKIELLNELINLTEANNLGLPIILKVRLSLAAAAFDYNLNHLSAMKPEYWENALLHMTALAKTLNDVDFDIELQADDEQFEKSPFMIKGCVVSLVERLDEEFFKMLKGCDPYGDEYISRLKDEVIIMDIVDHVFNYVERRGSDSARCRIHLSKISHLYYKLDKSIFEGSEGTSSLAKMDQYCKFVYVKDASHVLRTRAILSQIYHFALHDRWIEARNLMLMSHLQESIQHSDTRTQVLFNRTITQLGLCAFRVGCISDAHSCLADLMTSGRVKELLGQGFQPFRLADRTREQELLERQFQIPFHMHIPVELVEFVYLVSAMIIDIPYLTVVDTRRRIISKPLYQMLRMTTKQYLVGPPESLREHIAAACKALRAGQWQACYNLLNNPKMTLKVWNKIHQPTQVLPMLEKKIKSAALLTYVLSFASVYDSLSTNHLAEMFDLKTTEVHQQLAGIIIEEGFAAALDAPTDTLVPRQLRHTLLHSLAAQLAEKLNMLVDTNERSCRFGVKAGVTDARNIIS